MVWWTRRKYQKTAAFLAKHIHYISDQKIYDEVTDGIKKDAIAAGVEANLTKILKTNNLLGDTSWKKTNNQKHETTNHHQFKAIQPPTAG